MKKFYLLVVALLLSFVGAVSINAQVPLAEINVNYYRYDNLNETYTAWIWQNEPSPGDGVEDHFFVRDPDSNWFRIKIDVFNEPHARYIDATRLGIIVKQGPDWVGEREPGGDRFFDISGCMDAGGVCNIYLVQGDTTIYYDDADADTKHRILDAAFDHNLDVLVKGTTTPLNYKVFQDGAEIKTGVPTSKDFKITLSDVDLKKKYALEIEFDDGKRNTSISLKNLYDSEIFIDNFTYDGTLGAEYTKEKTIFKVWSPTADSISLNLYHQGHRAYDNEGKASIENNPYESVAMNKLDRGIFEITVNGDLHGKYYTFTNTTNNQAFEFVDPYAYSTGANGDRAMVVDFARLNPNNWRGDLKPKTIKNHTDYIIYETHVRDLTTHSTWGGNSELAGTFLGLAQSGTTYTKDGITVKTGLDHIVELGINAVHLLPIMDNGAIDETKMSDPKYVKDNGYDWGYMPKNFNAPEGSFATNPFDGGIRVNELKQLIQAFHEKGIRVIMDVVYNHTYAVDGSPFQVQAPDYFYRMNNDGTYSNGSGTGNETVSERYMMRKYMIDSVLFWAKEYNISGFRFDLMGLHDIETMNEIRSALDEVDPTIIIYGEPWVVGSTPLSGSQQANKNNMKNLNYIASFNDNSRDAIKGFTLTNNFDQKISKAVRYGIVGAAEITGANADDGTQSYHKEPYRLINYVSSHDDETIRDYFFLKGARAETLNKYSELANAITILSQGIPFIQYGAEILKSKEVVSGVPYSGDHRVQDGLAGNSYNLPDSVNQLNYNDKITNLNTFEYYRGLISIRRLFNHFRMASANEVRYRLELLNTNPNYIIYKIKGIDSQGEVIVIHTSNTTYRYQPDPNKTYYLFANARGEASPYGLLEYSKGFPVDVFQNSTVVLVEKTADVIYDQSRKTVDFASLYSTLETKPANNKLKLYFLISGIIVGAVALAGVGGFLIIKQRRKVS
ncbi:MAG: type I pullulanase [Acholeplasmataceae bacterium]|jgi:pullulanase|nr:type I pullulanase [Acholeplasmataceae bacterium]